MQWNELFFKGSCFQNNSSYSIFLIFLSCSPDWTIISELRLNPKRHGLFGGFFWKFMLSNFLSNKDVSVSYKSLDVQLTYDTLINALRFKAKVLGGTKVKSTCGAKLSEFRKTSVLSSIFIKISPRLRQHAALLLAWAPRFSGLAPSLYLVALYQKTKL
jgi:hypothetical protein